LGGVARRTREAVALCEGAVFDVVLIETVGVGQSETVVAQMADLFLLLLAPAGGDELQGVKRGIMEMADVILVNKADGDLKMAAMRTCADYSGALRLMRKRPQDPDGFPMATTVSALQEDGLQTAWDTLQELNNWRLENGFVDSTRATQAQYWFEQDVRAMLLAQLDQPDMRAAMKSLGTQVARGDLDPAVAATQMLSHLRGE
jgi:LAO/AO transport system kinase